MFEEQRRSPLPAVYAVQHAFHYGRRTSHVATQPIFCGLSSRQKCKPVPPSRIGLGRTDGAASRDCVKWDLSHRRHPRRFLPSHLAPRARGRRLRHNGTSSSCRRRNVSAQRMSAMCDIWTHLLHQPLRRLEFSKFSERSECDQNITHARATM